MQVSSLMRRWLAGMAASPPRGLPRRVRRLGQRQDGRRADQGDRAPLVRFHLRALYIAQDQGYFKSAGLQVTIKAGASDQSQNAPSVLRGEAQFAMSDSVQVAKGAEAGLAIKIVSGLQSSTTAAPPSDGLAVPADSPIKSFADVGGKTIALPNLGGSIQVMSNYAAEQAGVDPRRSNTSPCR